MLADARACFRSVAFARPRWPPARSRARVTGCRVSQHPPPDPSFMLVAAYLVGLNLIPINADRSTLTVRICGPH